MVEDVGSFISHYSHLFQVHKRNVSERASQYLKGLLQSRQRNMEKMAETVPDTDEQSLQQFLSDSPWDYQAVMNQVAEDANVILGGKDSALFIDESSVVKKGNHSVGVSRQWCGRLGKVDNCQVGVFAGLSKGSDVCLVDSELYLPKSWIESTERCDKARVPAEKRELNSKLDIALRLVKRARNNRLEFGWVGADSFYGRDKTFQKALDQSGETFMLDVPNDFRIYTHDPKPYLPVPSKKGRPPTRYKTDLTSLKAKQWVKQQGTKAFRGYTFRDGAKGPMKVEAIHQRVWVWDGRSAQANCWHLLVRRDGGEDIKYSISNALSTTSTHRLLYMQGQRHFIERSFQDSKSHLGLAQYQARNWNSWHHHMALIMMAMVFLLKQRAERKDNYPMLTVSDMVLIFSNILPSRMNNLQQVVEIIEQRHQKRRRDIQLKSQQGHNLCRWAEYG
ncbi:MAG: IS701 family transposase [Gammaproteobacteria bacterium]|nr:IS701 family transposase [Gammaproteobacteria bacterium]MCF6260996.1 IS701 family transposase [Gammaproteobacteria bacterium]